MSVADIERAVAGRLPGWKARADELAEQDLEAGRHLKRNPGHWVKISDFLGDAQHGKCAYCERYLGQDGSASTVDHYRPKGQVLAWRTKSVNFSDQPKGSPSGYYQLAYDMANYLGACGQCNQKKSSYFPVRAARQLYTTDQSLLGSERPLLINPADASDEDPEDLITFYGPLPQIRRQDSSSRLRALATIEILRLAHREDIIWGRCEILFALWLCYLNRDKEGAVGQIASEVLATRVKPTAPYSSCAKSFLLLCETNQEEAKELAELVISYLNRKVRYRDFRPQLEKRVSAT